MDKNYILKIGFITFTFGILFHPFTKFTNIPTYWPGIFLIYFYTLLFKPKIFLSKSVFISIILFIILCIYKLYDHLNDIPSVHTYPFGIFSFVFYYLTAGIIIENLIILKKNKYDFLVKTGKLSFILFILMTVITIYSENIFPGATRNIIKVELPTWVTTHTFGTMYGIPILLGVYISTFKGKYISNLLIISIFYICLIKSGFLTAFTFSIIYTLIAIIYRSKIKSKFLLYFLIVIFFFYFFNLFITILVKTGNPFFLQKVEELNELNANSEKSNILYLRENVYYLSIETFMKSPIFGNGTWKNVGEHSYWLDRLAFMGVVGTFFFFLINYILFKRALILVCSIYKKLYVTIILIFFMLLFVNPFYGSDIYYIVYVFIPLIINYFSSSKNSM